MLLVDRLRMRTLETLLELLGVTDAKDVTLTSLNTVTGTDLAEVRRELIEKAMNRKFEAKSAHTSIVVNEAEDALLRRAGAKI